MTFWLETCWNTQCDNIIYISKEEHCVFYWHSDLNINNAWNEKHKIDHLFLPRLDIKNLGSLCPLSIEFMAW